MKRILFVCVENSCRSQVAEAFVRIHGAGRVEAFSAGSRPSGKINAKAIEVMGEVGYDLSRHHSTSTETLSHQEYDIVITMGCGARCPQVRAKEQKEWEIPDPRAMPLDEFRVLRDLIEGRVKELLANLLQPPGSGWQG